jgi:class 3 adenylate cyclase
LLAGYNENGFIVANVEKQVSILFLDVIEFTKMLTVHEPTDVVCILDALYSTFDELCIRHGVQKMETVGKSFVACAGLHGTREDHAHAVCEMAQEMCQLTNKLCDKNGNRSVSHSVHLVSDSPPLPSPVWK